VGSSWRGRKEIDLPQIERYVKIKPVGNPVPPTPTSSARQVAPGNVVFISQLYPDDEFELVGMEEIKGTVQRVCWGWVEVRIDKGKRTVSIHDIDKGWRSFEASSIKVTTWSPRTLVRKLSREGH